MKDNSNIVIGILAAVCLIIVVAVVTHLSNHDSQQQDSCGTKCQASITEQVVNKMKDSLKTQQQDSYRLLMNGQLENKDSIYAMRNSLEKQMFNMSVKQTEPLQQLLKMLSSRIEFINSKFDDMQASLPTKPVVEGYGGGGGAKLQNCFWK